MTRRTMSAGPTVHRYEIENRMTRSTTMFPYERRKRGSTFRDSLSISVDDIYQMAERERLNYNIDSRRIALEVAQNMIHRIDHMPSRPNTSASRYFDSIPRDVMTPKSIRSEPPPSRASTSCEDRGQDDTESVYETDDMLTRMTPGSNVTLCDVIGPTMCGECRKTQSRNVDRERSRTDFPNIRIAENNITTTAILKRYFPNLSDNEIHQKISKGEIAKSTLPKLIQTKRERDVNTDTKRLKKKANTRTLPEQTPLFFSNLRDLNTQIVTGKANRRLARTSSALAKTASALSAMSSFKSPRKVQLMPEPLYQVFYDPPLLAKENQLDEPSFYAGCDEKYEVPNRLPEELVFVEKHNGVPASEDPESPDYSLLEEPLRVEFSYGSHKDGV